MVRAEDGQTIIIAGMMQDKKKETVTRVPFLGNIPGLGAIFRHTDREKEKTELVILLTPTVLVGKEITDIPGDVLKALEK